MKRIFGFFAACVLLATAGSAFAETIMLSSTFLYCITDTENSIRDCRRKPIPEISIPLDSYGFGNWKGHIEGEWGYWSGAYIKVFPSISPKFKYALDLRCTVPASEPRPDLQDLTTFPFNEMALETTALSELNGFGLKCGEVEIERDGKKYKLQVSIGLMPKKLLVNGN